ncbi:MAG: hypothetical protein ACI9F9_000239 [Candidatus Paceibacteria bacterium]|jgi:hypothetical protein
MARSNTPRSSDEEPRQRRRPKKSGPPVLPILGLVVLMIGAVVVARMAASRPKADDTVHEPKDASAVFGDLPVELPPVREKGRAPRRMVDNSPAGLTDNAQWVKAQGVVLEAAKVLAEAKTAKAAGDHGAWADQGTKSKQLYDEAIIMTADWELGLIEKYGDNDRQVDAIMKERSKWIDMLRILHKTTGR